MTFQNYKLFSPEEMKEVLERYPSRMPALPSSMQVGDRAKLWVWDVENPNSIPHPLPCVILRIEFGTLMPGTGIRYGVGLEIQGTGWWAVLDEIRGNLTPESVTDFKKGDDLVEVTRDVLADLARSNFQSIEGGKTADTPPSARPGLKLVPLTLPSLELDAPEAPG